MSRILVFQHSDLCMPGRFGRVLRAYGRVLDIRRPDRDGAGAVPRDLHDITGVISLGGPQNVTEGHDWMAAEMTLLRRAHEAGLPVVGICLGHQLIAAALGGRVAAMETPEIGFHEIELSGHGRDDPLLAGQPWKARQFCSHTQEVVELPPGAVVLAKSEMCEVELLRVGQRTYGFQYHFEWTRTMMEADTSQSAETLAKCGLTPDDLVEQFAKHYERFDETSTRLCRQIASLLFFRSRRESFAQ